MAVDSSRSVDATQSTTSFLRQATDACNKAYKIFDKKTVRKATNLIKIRFDWHIKWRENQACFHNYRKLQKLFEKNGNEEAIFGASRYSL